MDNDKSDSKPVVDDDVKEIFVSKPRHAQQMFVQPPETQISCQYNRANSVHNLDHHLTMLSMDPTVGSAMTRFRQFSDAFADYPSLQENLTLKDGPANGKFTHSRYNCWRSNINYRTGATLTKSQSRSEGGLSHRPTRSDEERRGMNPGMRPPPRRKNPDGELVDISASPEKDGERKPRRNSETSVADKQPMTEEERRRREKHRKERESRHRDGKRDGSRSRHGRRKPHGLDIIDKLDVTGIYGAGRESSQSFYPSDSRQRRQPTTTSTWERSPQPASILDFYVPTRNEDHTHWLTVFHHDGPFDACNPHRNRKKDHRAPMQAFPANSANMALGGSGPVNPRLDLNKIHGLGTEGYKDYGTGYEAANKRPDPSRNFSFDPYARTEPVHGEETFGLGTSTFLEGAPASRKAIERRESELEAQQRAELVAGGLGRKKSIAQRLRGMSTGRPRAPFPDGGIRSPEGRYADRSPGSVPMSPEEPPPKFRPIPTQTQSAGGPSRAPVTLKDEQNPFDGLYDEAYDKKGAQIKLMEDKKDEDKDENAIELSTTTERPLSSPRKGVGNPLERRTTADNTDEIIGSGGETKASGFLNRVKSLKGGRRPARNAS